MKKPVALACCLLLATLANSFVSVAGYQRMYLEDPEMSVGKRPVEQFELDMQSYREGASGVDGSKSGGGCGCN